MAIYEEKRGGVPTGRYRVEVMRQGVKKRATATSLQQARKIEESLEDQLLDPSRKRVIAIETPRLPTLSEARKRAQGRLWYGQTTETESFRKLDRIIAEWGEHTAVDAIDANSVDDLIVSLRAGGRKGNRRGQISEATINRYLSAVSAFLNFCLSRDLRKKPLPQAGMAGRGRRTPPVALLQGRTGPHGETTGSLRHLGLLCDPYRTESLRADRASGGQP